MESKPKPTPRRRFWRRPRFWSWFGVSLLTLFLLTLLLLPMAIRLAVQSQLRKQGQSGLVIRNVNFNPFTGRLTMHCLVGGPNGKGWVELGRMVVNVDWWPLHKRRVNVPALSLSDVAIDVRRDASGVLSVGGLVFKPSPPTASTRETKPWGFALGGLDLDNVVVHYTDPRLDLRAHIVDVHVSPLATWRPDTPTTFTLSFRLNDGDIHCTGSATPFSKDPRTTASIQVTGLPLACLEPLLEDNGVRGFSGELGARAELDAQYRPKTQTVQLVYNGSLSLKDLKAEVADASLQRGAVSWTGRVAVEGAASSPVATARGKLEIAGVNAQLTSPSLGLTQSAFTWQGEAAYGAGEAGSVSMTGDLSLKDLAVEDLARGFTLAGIEDLRFSGGRIKREGPLSSQTLNVGGTLRVAGIRARIEPQGLGVTQSTFDWKGEADYQAGEAGSVSMTGDLSLKDLAVEDLARGFTLAGIEDLRFSEGRIKREGQLSSQTLNVGGTLHVDGIRARIEPQGLEVTQSAFDWKGEVTAGGSAPTALVLLCDVGGEGLSVQDAKSSQSLAGLGAFRIQDARFEAPSNAEAGRIGLSGLWAFEREGDRTSSGTIRHLVALKELVVDRVRFQPSNLGVESIRFSGLDARIDIDGKRNLQILERTRTFAGRPASGGQTPKIDAASSRTLSAAQPTSAASPTSATRTLAFSVGHIEFAGDNRIVFLDESVKPSVRMTVTPFIMSLDRLDMAAPLQMSPLTLNATVNRYGTLTLDGSVAPFAPVPIVNVKASAKELNLPPLSSYAERAIGYRLRRGVLNADVKVLLDNGLLDSACGIVLNQIELGRLEAAELDPLASQIGLPLNTALALLRDSDDRITLNIPVSGNIRDPQFHVAGVIRQAMLGGLTGALGSVLKPLGLTVELGKRLVGQGGRLTFKPAEFMPGETDFAPETTKYLDTLKATLRERPHITLSLSGLAVAADTRALQQKILQVQAHQAEMQRRLTVGQSKSTPADGSSAPPPPPIPNNQLLGLAERRGRVVKNYLTDHNGVDPRRLLLTTPAVNNAPDVRPQVEISL